MGKTMQGSMGAMAEGKRTAFERGAVSHSVQFYSEDSFLVAAVSRFLESALEQGGSAIVVATPAHRAALSQSLEGAGLDLPRLRKLRRFTELDAETTLSKVMVENWPNRERISDLAGQTIAEARGACEGDSGEVAIYGEMVNVLCARGRVDAAVHLEQLWNEVLEKHPASLLCGYPVETFNQETSAATLSQVCAHHHHVSPAEGYLQLNSEQERLRYVVRLQQEAAALKTEIRERERAQEALVRAEKGAALGRLAASIAHEINNPLTSLTNLLYLMQAQSASDSGARQYAALADVELRRISRITKQMLGFYRDSSSPVFCKLSDVADGILELYEAQIQKNRISVQRDYLADGAIECFPSEMRQLFANLIGNALEAAGIDGRIRVRITKARCWADPRNDGVRVSIADNGAGIAATNKECVFEPFFSTKGESGTGLGLWVCQGIVHKHQGRISFRSRTDHERLRGTTFSVFLAASPSKPR
jgi:signal transduction histidine kinase